MLTKPFRPRAGATVSVSATTVSARAHMAAAPSNGRFQVRLFNAGADLAFVAFGGPAVAATAADHALPSGAVEVVTVDSTDADPHDYVAAICASGSATVYAAPGEGI
mgnify:FL=1